MKKCTLLRRMLSALCCAILLFSTLPTAQAASLKASVVTGKVTLNGQVIDNKTAKYPLLLYSNITYFPMTYYLSSFMGIETVWDGSALYITAGHERGTYVAETGKKQSGTVSVTLPSYPISINGAAINNKEEAWPIFNYNGVTYFPLTYTYAYDAFGWVYVWDAENGLRVDASSAPTPVSTAPNTGNAALDAALTVLNDGYVAGGTYSGTLSGKDEKESFTASLSVTSFVDARVVSFTAEPFPFFEYGKGYFTTYYLKSGGFTERQAIGYSGTGSSPLMVDETSEKAYIGKCFLDCQFAGERSGYITKATMLASEGESATWELTVDFCSGSYTGYTAQISFDTENSAVTKISIRTENYELTMIPI